MQENQKSDSSDQPAEIEPRAGQMQSVGELLQGFTARWEQNLASVPDKTCQTCGAEYYGKLEKCPECERRAEEAAREIERRRARQVEVHNMIQAAFGLHAGPLLCKPWGVKESKAAKSELKKPAPVFYLFGMMSTDRDRLRFAAAITRRWLESNNVHDGEEVKAINWIHAPSWWDSYAWRTLEPKMTLPVLVLENIGSAFNPTAWIVLSTLLERRLAQPHRLTIITSRYSPEQFRTSDPECAVEGLQALLRIILPNCCKIEI
ncbi:MAG: hypothetical protein C4519_00450 [Desulfobacteraceae bacterium]|nr:MAG: hypothetical protein C4519_00450 [Desulfobacteraceae bacterium]